MRCITSRFRSHRKQLASIWMDLQQNSREIISCMDQHKVHFKQQKHNPHMISLSISVVSLALAFSQPEPCLSLLSNSDWMPVMSQISLWLEGAHSVPPNHSSTPPIDTWATWLCPLARALMWISRVWLALALRPGYTLGFILSDNMSADPTESLFSFPHTMTVWNLDVIPTQLSVISVMQHFGTFVQCTDNYDPSLALSSFAIGVFNFV